MSICHGARRWSPTSSGRFVRWGRAHATTFLEPSNRSRNMSHSDTSRPLIGGRSNPGFLPGAGLIVLASLSAFACATAPPPRRPAAPTVPVEQKVAWILQLEDQRILKLPEPAPPPPVVPVKGSKPVPPPPASAPDLTALATDADPRVRRRAAVAIGRVGLNDGIAALTALLADGDT